MDFIGFTVICQKFLKKILSKIYKPITKFEPNFWYAIFYKDFINKLLCLKYIVYNNCSTLVLR